MGIGKSCAKKKGLPGVGGRTEGYGVVGPRTACKGAGFVIVRIAVSVRTCAFEDLRISRWLACIGSAKRAITTVLRLSKGFTRALASNTSAATVGHNLKLRRTRGVQVDNASRACTIGSVTTLRNDKHGEVVAVDQTDIIEVLATIAIELELSKSGGRGSTTAGAFQLAAAITCDAGELTGGVLGAECSGPHAAAPRSGCVEGLGLSLFKGEAGGGECGRVGVRENAGPYRVVAFVDHCEGGGCHTGKY